MSGSRKAPSLDFASGPLGADGWTGEPADTTSLDADVHRSTPPSARIQRDADSQSTFSVLSRALPIDFTGEHVELRGWLRLRGVQGTAGLWLRQDGPGGVRRFDTMEGRWLEGTTDFAEHRLSTALDPLARSLTIGAVLSGTGQVWLDDVEVWVDGAPLADAPVVVPPPFGPDVDHAFDDGSGVTITTPTSTQVDHLALLGRVWGFVKYRHPAVTRGTVHWDYELLRALPAVLAATDRHGAEAAIDAWLARLGDPPPREPREVPPEDLVLAPRLGWIDALGPALAKHLGAIHAHRDPSESQYWVRLHPHIRNPQFDAELAYPTEGEVPDPGYRLLAAFRWWNIIEAFSPYRDLIDEDWDAVLTEFTSRTLGAQTREDYARTMLAMVARVNDSHSNLWSATHLRDPIGRAQLPVHVRFIEGRPVVVGYSEEAAGPETGLQIGDVLLAFDGQPIAPCIDGWRELYGASNDWTQLRDIARSITRGEPGPVRVTVARAEAEEVTLTAERIPPTPPQVPDDPPLRRLSDELAYLRLPGAKATDAQTYVEAAFGARVLLIDLREYPAFLVFPLGQHLVSEPLPFVRFTGPDPGNPGAMRWRQTLSLTPKAPRFEGAIAILIDERTQSRAEYTAMAWQTAPGAILVGSPTAGADGDASHVPLPGGQRAMISGKGVFYPDGRPTQRVGLQPDVEVRPTVAGIRAGRDEVLEAAVRATLDRPLTEDEREALRRPSPRY